MSNWAQKLEDRLCILSLLWLIPYFGFFNGVDRLMDERTRSDINQLLIQVNYNIQVLWRLVDLAKNSNENFPLSYISLVVDICPSLQQHLHNGEMPMHRGIDKGRVPPLHHIDRHG